MPVLRINVGPENISYSEFVKEGFSKLRNEPSEILNSAIEAKDITITPHSDEVCLTFLNLTNNVYFDLS